MTGGSATSQWFVGSVGIGLVEMGSFIVPPMTVPILGFEVPSKFSNSTAPGTEDVVAPGVTEIVIAYDGVLVKVNASNDRPSAALSFDFMTVTPLNRPPQPQRSRRMGVGV